ncbi:UvrD-helicase domain-containing protein [Poriferisphaera sp. WC338]|uniref:UvrD-helicase domain-containing protein n=1 Tax=Poriferisphaera sp. WC338 TaxID=3425129 RepID=UPI003D81C267
MLKLNKKHKKILSAGGHMLVTGGPGSGKTTISILKAADIAQNQLHPSQMVLFLSFARATVSRVLEAINREHQLDPKITSRIQVETYHAFFWSILKTHGYLLGLPRQLSILLPKDEAIALSAIRNKYGSVKKFDNKSKKQKASDESEELERLAYVEGRVCFKLFAPLVAELLHRSCRLRNLVSLMYPRIIIDEFQDTNATQWHVIKALAEKSMLFALADPEQRIYDWIGADPKRLDHFRKLCTPVEVDFGSENHRSRDTDIRTFGDDVMQRSFRQKQYSGIFRIPYTCNQNQAFTAVVTCVLKARKRLVDSGVKQWSIGILTPTKILTRKVSDNLRSPPANLPVVRHFAAVDKEAAVLAAELISSFLQERRSQKQLALCVDMLCNFYKGKGGDTPSQSALKEAAGIHRAYKDCTERLAEGKKVRGNSLIVATMSTLQAVCEVSFTGAPDQDWLAVRDVLDKGKCKRLRAVAEEARNIRLLDRGTQLRQALSENWQGTDCYPNALEITRQAFVQEHFNMAQRPEQGIVVMNMHKAKGKQFDEVIIFEGWPRYSKGTIVANLDRIVRENLPKNVESQARQNFRVSITRAKLRTTILTPECDPCILLFRKTS